MSQPDSRPEPAPVAVPKVELLSTDVMPWERLESLVRRIAQDVEGLRDVHVYGVRGQSQNGIDVVGVAVDGAYHAFQCKRQKKFTVANLTEAVESSFANEAP